MNETMKETVENLRKKYDGATTPEARDVHWLLAHIAALATERDEQALKARACSALAAERGAGLDALRERVQTLDYEVALMKEWAKNSEEGRERAREVNATLQTRLAAIRQRAGDERRMAEHSLPSEKAGLVTRAIDRILGEDATAKHVPHETPVGTCHWHPPSVPPEAFTHKKGLDAGVFDEAPQPNARVIAYEGDQPIILATMPPRPEPTTPEAFAALRVEWSEATNPVGVPSSGRFGAMLSLLERRMGAMERASRDLIAALESTRWSSGCWCSGKVKAGHSATCAGRQAAIIMAEKALTDAPPVFTLEEVKEALGRGSTVDDVVAILTALRK